MSIAEEVLAKVEAFGSVISTNIKPSIFVQFAVGNNDLNEETPHSKNTTHATKMVVYQKKTFCLDPPLKLALKSVLFEEDDPTKNSKAKKLKN